MAKIVRGSITTTMKHRYLAIWLTYCISIALLYSISKTRSYAQRVVNIFIYILRPFERAVSIHAPNCNISVCIFIYAHTLQLFNGRDLVLTTLIF